MRFTSRHMWALAFAAGLSFNAPTRALAQPDPVNDGIIDRVNDRTGR